MILQMFARALNRKKQRGLLSGVLFPLVLLISQQCVAQDLSRCVSPRSLSLSVLVGAASSQHILKVGNDQIQGCSVTASTPFTAAVSFLNGAGWLSVNPTTGTFLPGQVNTLKVDVNYSSLTSVTAYQALINVSFQGSNTAAVIPVTVAINSARPRISLSWNSFVFQTVEGTSAPPPQTLRLYNGVPGNLNWAISQADLPSWLSVSPLAGTAGSEPGQGSRLTISVNPAGLTAGASNNAYTALVPVSSTGASNDPQYVSITFHVVKSTAAPVPLLTSYGLLFQATQGGAAPAPQTFVFSNTGGGGITAQFTLSASSCGSWLSLSRPSANTTAGPATIEVRANPAGLSAGVCRGKITGAFTTSVARAPQEVGVVLIVSPPGAALQRLDAPANGLCAPTNMELVGTTVGNGLNVPVSFPQVLLALVVDNCGTAVTNATAVATAEGVSIPLTPAGGGFYTGTWVPQRTATSSIVSFSVFHPTFPPTQQSFTVSTAAASGGTVLPLMFSDGVVEGAGFTPGRPLVPGAIISLFGARLAPSVAVASVIPLERELAGASVRIGRLNAPLYFVSDGQINAQVPFEAVPGETVSIVVNNGGRLTAPQTYQISPAQPGIFTSETGAAILDSQSRLITAQNPARVGDILQIYAGGLGATNPPVASGAGGPPSSTVLLPVTVTMGGVDAQVVYQGLAPNFVGLYQVNAIVPSSVTPGDAVPVVLRQNGIPSNPNLPIAIPVRP